MIDSNARKQAIAAIDDLFGSEISGLKKCPDIYKQFQSECECLTSQLSRTNGSVLLEVETNLCELNDRLEKEIERVERQLEQVNKQQLEVGCVLETTRKYVNDIGIGERAVLYLKTITLVDQLSTLLTESLQKDDNELSVTIYANLSEVSLGCQEYETRHLKNFVRDVIHHWHNLLKNKFGSKFDDLLAHIKWPFIGTNIIAPQPTVETLENLQLIAEYLLQIQLPDETKITPKTTIALADFAPLSLPIHYMIQPFKKRFNFHFYGTKPTNRADKPEWYMTQILKWIRDHERFVCDQIQPVVNRLGLRHAIDARLEFIQGLVELAVEKLHAELPELAYDDELFSHCVDEILSFDRELKQVWEYPKNRPGPLGPLSSATLFQKWLKMERKFAMEKMDVMLASPTAWSTIISSSDDDSTKVTECADAFVNLLTTMCERYRHLPQPGHKLQFLNLQLELLDDYRVRLLQLVNCDTLDPITSTHPFILNTIAYIECTLVEWSSNVHYISLHYFNRQFAKHETMDSIGNDEGLVNEGGVFDGTLSLYKHFKDDLMLTLCEAVVMDVKARSRPYRLDNWSTKPLIKESISLSLTTTACPMFQLLVTRLHQLEEILSVDLFTATWKVIAKQLNAFLFKELVLENDFNEGGVRQLTYDITKNIFPLFAQYTKRPEAYFIHLKESCTLLNLAKGSALMLRDTLTSTMETSSAKKAVLMDVGVKKLDVQTVLSVLKCRVDIKEKDMLRFD